MSQEVNTVVLSREVYDEFVETTKKLKELQKHAKVGFLSHWNTRYNGYVKEVVGAAEVYEEVNKQLLIELKKATERLELLERKLSEKELINRTPKTNWWNVFAEFKDKTE